MTAQYPDPQPVSPGSGPAASDVDSCLVLVTSYVSAATLVERVTTEAIQRLMMSPALGDFIELRYAHLGPQPESGGQRSAAARVTDQLLQPRPGIGRSYFAVVVLDRSAAAVQEVLQDCAASPFLGQLPLRLLGIASREDRRAVRLPAGADVLVSPVGSWQRPQLIDEVLRYANDLLHGFAGGRRPGLTPDELARYRDQFAEHIRREQSVRPRAGVATTGSFAALPDGLGAAPGVTSPPMRDALDPGADPGAPAPADVPSAPPAVPTPAVPAAPVAPDGPSVPATAPDADGGTWRPAAPAPRDRLVRDHDRPDLEDAEPTVRSRSRLVRRLVPESWRRRDRQPEGEPPSPAAGSGLAYLLLIGDPDGGEQADWNRGRTLALEVDQRLALLPRLSAYVRLLEGDDVELSGELRPAGELTKREARGVVSDLYLAKVLDQVLVMLGRDQARLSSGPPLARPVVVLLAPVPPLTDTAAVASLRRLAQEALVTWAVPKSQQELLSEEFTEAGELVTDFTVAADDIAAQFPAFPVNGPAEADDAAGDTNGAQEPHDVTNQG